MADVKLELVKEEAADAAWGIIHLHDTSASIFITVGLDLEEQQYVYSVKLLLVYSF